MRGMREGLRLTTPTRLLGVRRAVFAVLVTIASGCRPAALLPAQIDASAEDVPSDVALADAASDHVDVVDAGSVDAPDVVDAGSVDVPAVVDAGSVDVPAVVDVGTDAGIDPLTVGLIAHYAFDGNANDSSGTGAPGGIVAGASLDVDRCGRASSAYRFNGAGSIAFAPYPRIPIGSAARTLAVWWKTSDVTGGFRTAANWGLPIERQRFQISAMGQSVQVAFATYGFNGSRPTNDNVWHSIVATYDGTVARLYVDGTPDGTDTRMLITMGQSLFVGRAVPGNPTDEYFVGTLDDVRIYDRALPAGEVASLAARGPCDP